MAAIKTQECFASHGLKHNVTKTHGGSEVHSYTSDLGSDSAILTLIHGWPQSAYEWRYLVPLLNNKISLFVPELPGYGISTPQKQNDKGAIGATLLEALVGVFGPNRRVILGGHDRGGHICHRLAVDVDRYPIKALGTIILEVVPISVQWRVCNNPKVASQLFHWPFMANVETAVGMIQSYGAAKWIRSANERVAGPSEIGKARVAADNANDIYAELLSSEEATRYTCEDYRAGAQEDVTEEESDQQAGRKINIPTLVVYSKSRFGDTMDCEAEWREWVADGVDYECVGVGDERGHYLPEEAYEVIDELMTKFVNKLAP
ncbi:Fluoroacetate dehalogenase [Cyphellophora attinorum]|uniref:Fluoroacetate dehalogenase n=1 Tax=Cyphellophora attinorum TaxID=1664694 RepID=A0A0N0NLZ5_9EURO|nr:Fluoroacetate dehalogenase [Phialophora attinorum]KPI39871.1 Fluoroacetate dehalogenase [Phialophora attinorum]